HGGCSSAGRAPGCGPGCRGFKSLHSPQSTDVRTPAPERTGARHSGRQRAAGTLKSFGNHGATMIKSASSQVNALIISRLDRVSGRLRVMTSSGRRSMSAARLTAASVALPAPTARRTVVGGRRAVLRYGCGGIDLASVQGCAVKNASSDGGVVREVEVKYHIRDLDALLAALAARGIALSGPIHQDDQAYAPEDWRYGDSKLGVSFVRLRTVDGRHTFTLKRPAENALSCDEYETAVADREQMHRAILAMGFRSTVRIVKLRRAAELPSLSLCVDEVPGLGTFLELERMVPDD